MLNKIMCKLNNFKKDESGASAIEYAVMAALLVGVLVAAILLLDFGSMFTNVTEAVNGAGGAGGAG